MSITVFGTHVCPNCQDVKRFLDSAGVDYSYKVIGEDVEHMYVSTLVGRPVRSVPVIVQGESEVTFDQLRQSVVNEPQESLEDVKGSLAGLSL